MKFRIIKGIHSQGGVVYEAGTDHDIIESDIDLIKSFNNNGKFERLTVPIEEIETYVKFKNDVSEKFPGCSEMGIKVFHENGQFFVIKEKTGQPIHETKITNKDTVRTLLEGMK